MHVRHSGGSSALKTQTHMLWIKVKSKFFSIILCVEDKFKLYL